MYYVVFQYYNDGRTIGKAIYKLKIKNKKGKKLKIYQLFFRYCVLLGIITSVISIISLFMLPMNSCINVLSFVQTIDDTLILSCILMILFRKKSVNKYFLF